MTAVLRSAAAAYRADLTGRDTSFGEHDDAWIIVATLLEQAAAAHEAGYPSEAASRGLEFAASAAGRPAIERVERDWHGRGLAPADAVVALADGAHDEGAFHTAGVLLDALLAADPSLTELQRGRVMVRRARASWKLGRMDEARDRYVAVERLGREAGEPELQARAWIGLGALAHMRGNYPAVTKYSRRAARIAHRLGHPLLERNAHLGLMISEAAAGHFGEALVHGWRVYRASADDVTAESEILQNMGQLLLESGRAREARAAFAEVVTRALPGRILLPAVGGIARAGAALSSHDDVTWAVREISRLPHDGAPQYALTSALLECAEACSVMGLHAEAKRLRSDSLARAKEHGFHEIVYRIEAGMQMPQPVAAGETPVTKRVAEILRFVGELEPDQLPAHVALAAGPE